MATTPAGAPSVSIRLTVNGTSRALDLDVRTTLLDALREHLNLKGAKKGCDHGQCGACTVLVNGLRINACLSLAVMHDGDEVTTIEGIGLPDRLAPAAAGLPRPRRLPVRLLHARSDLLGGGPPGRSRQGLAQRRDRRPDRAGQAHRRRDPGADERQHLPLLGLSADPGSDPRRGGAGAREAVHLQRAHPAPPKPRAPPPNSPARKFLAGGTNLLDLMKLEIEHPDASHRHRPPAASRDRRRPDGGPAHRGDGDERATSPPTPACGATIRCWPRR